MPVTILITTAEYKKVRKRTIHLGLNYSQFHMYLEFKVTP